MVQGHVEARHGRHAAGVERAVDGADARDRREDGVEAELGEVGPEAAPAAGEDAGAHRSGGGGDAVQDLVEEIVGEFADAVRPVPMARI